MAEYCGQFTFLFCCPSIISQALRAAMVAAEVPLRGKLRAEATHFQPTHSSCTSACKHCYTGINLILSSRNCPVLNPWGILYMQTALVLLGAWQRPRIRRRALRAPSLDPRTFPNVALRAVRLPLVELGIIVRIEHGRAKYRLFCEYRFFLHTGTPKPGEGTSPIRK